ncbi:related to SAM50-essential component of the SAM or TOB complex of the mitochondrial outer membrane [Sporisorium reilianum f. sp. reilianum]|uniref:Related to SAM50-essential component of the SAM or TOB complex of the mitochondrial outer membrane n=1 Tax=Sporisorium reilianum f. sp. reilianum TaxID=72559 RepID=A0A2N8UFH6_9BASI|nr:related to SAM50-essential component of the SAM or TOB complex of the mitochondrial outer membrane [Sporisorium reilianum f. sp. reilianum]
MEFSSLKEQRADVHDAAEARAAAAAASADADTDPASTSQPSSSDSSTRRKRPKHPQSTETASTAAAETPFGKAMANPEDQQDAHTQPLEDGSLPTPGLGSPEHASATSASDGSEEAEEPIKPHNLLSATELIQAGGDPLSPFAPAPILRLNAIRISGAGRALRPGYLASLCRPYMDPYLSDQNPNANILNSLYYGSRTSHVLPGQPTTLPSILALTSSLAGDLDKLDVFRNIEASLAPSIFPGASEEDVDVILACGKPKGRVFLKSSTDVGNGEGSASVQGRIRNVFGGAETLQGSATFGTRTKQAFNLEFGGPLAGNPDIEYKLAAFSHDRDYSAFASLSESVQGLRASINSSFTDEPKGVIDPVDLGDGEAPTTTTTTQHEVAYEASLRELGRVMGDASVAVRKMAVAPSVKSALSWTWVRESRDSPVLPSRGSKVRTLLEYAGLGGDAQHVKAEVEASTGRHFSPLQWLFPSLSTSTSATASPFLEEPSQEASSSDADAALSAALPSLHPIFTTLTFRSGLLHPLSPSSAHFSDRFQLGGPTSLRMFRHSSLGPKSDADSLGGDAFWSLGLSLLSPIPRKPHWPLMLHAFANAGQIGQLPHKPAGAQYWSGLKQLAQPSSSVGVGVVYMQGQLRVELNAGVPLTARCGDGTRKGLQLGIGIDFL